MSGTGEQHHLGGGERLEQHYSPGDLLAISLRALERDDLNPMERAAFAVVVACGGDETRGCNFDDAAAIIGVSAVDLRASLVALRERSGR